MGEYQFSLARILPYKDKIVDFVLIRENTGKLDVRVGSELASIYDSLGNKENS